MDSNIINIIKKFNHKGAYDNVVQYIESLPLPSRQEARVVLEKYRAFLKQGYAVKAEETLVNADNGLWTTGEKLVWALEMASIKIYRYFKIEEAMSAAKAAFETYKGMAIAEADIAEAERIYCRIQICAATYRLIGPQEKEAVMKRLAAVAIVLATAGKIDESLAASFTCAEHQKDPVVRFEAMVAVADSAVQAGRFDLAAEACIFTAQLMLKAAYPIKQIREKLIQAEELYNKAEHVYGLIDIQRQKAMLDVNRHLSPVGQLILCLQAYEKVQYYRGMLSLLMDLSQLAHEQGDARSAKGYRDQMMALTDKTGMGISRDSVLMSEIDLCTRNADYGTAIELCQAAILSGWPAVTLAGYEVQLATAFSFIDDYTAASAHCKKAVELYMSVDAVDYASDIIPKLASDLSSLHREDAWLEAEDLLEHWLKTDEKQKNIAGVISKQEMLAQLKLQRFNFSNDPGKNQLPAIAQQIIQSALVLTQQLPAREGVKRKGNLLQLMAQVSQAKGDEEAVIQCWKDALGVYETAGFTNETINCHYILGVFYLNRANHDLATNFLHAENHLKIAISGYDDATMREKSADTRYMLSLLYANASRHVDYELSNQLLDAAVDYLFEAETDYDNIRKEFKAGDSVTRVHAGKQALVKKSQRIYQLALQIHCIYRPDPVNAWNWVQRAKARGLTDILGIGAAPPAQVMTAIEKYPDSYRLIEEEKALTGQINKTAYYDQLELRKQLQALWKKMREDEHLAGYLEIRTGAALDIREAGGLFFQNTPAGNSMICIDWVNVGNLLYMLILRSAKDLQLVRLSIQLSEVQAFVLHHLKKEAFRSNLRDTPEVLRALDSLITPIADYCRPDELLVLCPTGPLYGLPLHALEIGGKALIERNPVVYMPSLSTLKHCLLRQLPSGISGRAALFGDPSGDRPRAAELVNYLAAQLRTEPLLRQEVTKAAFQSAIANKDIVHFQGHAVYDPAAPLASYIDLADGRLTANDIFNVEGLQADLVTLAACESASSYIAAGDEPMGLIPAFLYAGARAVMATLWNVNQTSAAGLMQTFYDRLLQTNDIHRKAQALREAMVMMKAKKGFESPYHWAPFVLYGNWH